MSLDIKNPQTKLIYDTALKMLTRREHSQKELSFKIKQKLQEENINSVQIAEVVMWLESHNYQSDLRYAQMLCQTRVNQRYGNKKISYELSHQGINSEIISTVLSEYDITWAENARYLINKKLSSSPEKVDKHQIEKLKSYLLQKGYDLSVINTAISNYPEQI